MKAAILSVGTELLFGHVVNTNAADLSAELNRIGIDVLYHFTVGDNPVRLKKTLETALSSCDLVVTTGGLGPTQDDLTKETVAGLLGLPLELHEESLGKLQDFFNKVKRPMTDNNVKQAYFPKGAVILPNSQGTAPGFLAEKDGRLVACLPGPPREMRAMAAEALMPLLAEYGAGTIHYTILRTCGIGESALETALLDLIDAQKDTTIATYAGEGECWLRIASKSKDSAEAEARVKQTVDQIKERVGEYVYSTDGRQLHEVVAGLLVEKGLTLSCAESCTGGQFAARMTSVPGASAYFDRGIVAYSNQAKIEELGVSPDTLAQFGAVSAQTAREMAVGLRLRTESDLCVSVTGISGPDGGSEAKPVGTAFIAIAAGTSADGTVDVQVWERRAGSSRAYNNTLFVKEMLFRLYRQLNA